MSFICANCFNPAPRNVSPFVVDFSVAQEHYQVLEEGRRSLVGHGLQIQRETKLCPTCSGVKIPATVAVNSDVWAAWANGFALKHARKCEGFKSKMVRGVKVQTPCAECADIVKVFASLAPLALARATENDQAPPAHFSLAGLLVDGLDRQNFRKGKRAARDFATSYNVLRRYEQRGGTLGRVDS